MRGISGAAVMGLLALADAWAQGTVSPVCDKLLPAADVGKATGRPNVKLIPGNPRVGAGGDCNYAINDSTMVMLLMVNQATGLQGFQRLKSERIYQTNQKPVPGLGDEAFAADGILPASVLVARKGNLLVTLSAFVEVDPATGNFKGYVRPEQLVMLARSMLAR